LRLGEANEKGDRLAASRLTEQSLRLRFARLGPTQAIDLVGSVSLEVVAIERGERGESRTPRRRAVGP
jgi:hypothetical protein